MYGARILAALIVCVAFVANDMAAAATTGSPTLLQAGNEAFRAGNYQAAISKYQQAKADGNRSAALDFNLGVAHYRLAQYADADVAFRSAARDSRFAARAWYNLGLVSWARNDLRDARGWLERVRRSSDARLKSLAARALADIDRGVPHPRARRSTTQSSAAGTFLMAAARWGHDDNVFRTPRMSYIDLSQTGQPTITPVRQSGGFTELNLRARKTIDGHKGTIYRLAYDFDGRFYLDSGLRNGDEQLHRVSTSTRTVFGAQGNRTLQALAYVGVHREINFDPDDGLERTLAGEDLSRRFSYWNAVLAGDYTQSFGRIAAGLHSRAELRNYEAVASVAEYDSYNYLAGTHVDFPLLERMNLKLEYDYSIRDYQDRRARAIDGSLLGSNPRLEYRYHSLAATMRYQFERAGELRVGYDFTHRSDVFAGYNDYKMQMVMLEGTWRASRRLRMNMLAVYRDYDYASAFAFDTPQGGARTLRDFETSLGAEVRLTRHLRFWGEVRYWDVKSSDTRTQYSRLQVPVGVKWARNF